MDSSTKVSLMNKLEYLLLAFLFITLPLKNSFNSAAIILLTIFSLVKIKSFDVFKFRRFYLFFVLFLIVLFSLIYTKDLSKGLRYVEKYSIFLVIPFILSVIQINKKRVFKLLLLFSTIVVFLSIYCEFIVINQLILNGDPLSTLLDKRYSYLNFSQPVDIHPAYFSLFIIVAILTYFTYIVYFKISNLRKVAIVIILIYLSWVILQLSNRTYLLILFIVLNWCFYRYLTQINKRKITKALFLAVSNLILILVVANTGYSKKRIQQVFGYTYANGYKHEDGKKKLLQWEAAVGANKNAIFGNGMGDAKQSILNEYNSREYSYYLKNSYNAHNQYLETYVGLGIIGLFCLTLIIFQGILRAIKSSIGPYMVLFYIIPIAFLTESYLERHHGLIFFCLVHGLISVLNHQSSLPNLIFETKK